MRIRRTSKRVTSLLAAGLLAACAKPSPATVAASEDATLQVVAANLTAQTLTLQGAGLPQPGKDGTQTVKVGAGDAAIGYVGQTVRGELGQSGGSWWFNNVWPADPAAEAVIKEASRSLQADTVTLGRNAFRDVGDDLPDFALYNQDGKLMRSSSLKGHLTVMNFIFTRCAQPTMCPASTTRMRELQQALKAAKIDNVSLVTITFDPGNDTPGVLREYGQAYGISWDNYQFLTGPEDEINNLMKDFGILTRTKDGILQHTVAVYLISPEGRILYRFPSENWTMQDLLGRIQRDRSVNKSS